MIWVNTTYFHTSLTYSIVSSNPLKGIVQSFKPDIQNSDSIKVINYASNVSGWVAWFVQLLLSVLEICFVDTKFDIWHRINKLGRSGEYIVWSRIQCCDLGVKITQLLVLLSYCNVNRVIRVVCLFDKQK